jgi:Ulp1 family protease
MRSTRTELARPLVNRGRVKLADLGDNGLGTVANTLTVRDLLSLRTTAKDFRTLRPPDWLNDWLKSHRD